MDGSHHSKIDGHHYNKMEGHHQGKIAKKAAASSKVVLPNGEIDKFAFTDEDETLPPISPRKLHVVKSEPSSAN